MVKPVVQIGDPVLRVKAKPLTSTFSGQKLRALIKNLTDSMHAANLIGIAGPQIGVGLQIFITEIRATKHRKNVIDADPLRVFINPKIIAKSKRNTVLMEGCGSLAHGSLHGPVSRPEWVEVEALDEHGKKFTFRAAGLLAKAVQHEYDHLQGTVIIDKFMNTKKVVDRDTVVKLTKTKKLA